MIDYIVPQRVYMIHMYDAGVFLVSLRVTCRQDNEWSVLYALRLPGNHAFKHSLNRLQQLYTVIHLSSTTVSKLVSKYK